MFSILFQTLMLTASAQANSPPNSQSKLVIEPCKTAEAYAFSKSECVVKLFNSGDRQIRISNLRADANDDALPIVEMVVQPGSEAFLTIGFNAGNATGATYHTYRLGTDEPAYETRTFGIREFVLTAFDEFKPELDFGAVDEGGARRTKNMYFHSQELASWKIVKLLESPSWLETAVTRDGHGIEAAVKPNTAWGLQAGFVKLSVDLATQKELWVWAKADVHGQVIPSSNPFDTGLLRFGNHNELKILLTQRADKDFKVGDIYLKDLIGSVKSAPCVPARSGCASLELTISDQQPAGSIRGYIQVAFPEYKQKLSIMVTGMIFDPKRKVIDLNSPEAQATLHAQPRSVAPNAVDLSSEIKMAVQAADTQPPPGSGPLLKWKIANGSGIHGFQLFRSDDEKGPFVLINRETIRSRSVTSESQEYQYRDNTAVSGTTYWYYIGIVYADGHKQQLTGPQKVVAK